MSGPLKAAYVACLAAAILFSHFRVVNEVEVKDSLVTSVTGGLRRFVLQPEPDFSWKVRGRRNLGDVKLTELVVRSQRWHGVPWDHLVAVFEPPQIRHPRHMLVFVSGGVGGPGRVSETDLTYGSGMAKAAGMRMAIVRQVPNQPLKKGQVEDDAVTETWLRYLRTGDETWILNFAMAKAVSKSMDALEEFTARESGRRADSFILTGFSKRGWACWLTAAADDRVVAIAPISIEVLNLRRQLAGQRSDWGWYADELQDYFRKGLVPGGRESPRLQALWTMVDPMSYRDRLALPKLIVGATNDPYWLVDSQKYYWNELPGPKYSLRIANEGHMLPKQGEKAAASVAIFARRVAAGEPMPALAWSFSKSGLTTTVDVTSSERPAKVRLWQTRSGNRNFRYARWRSMDLPQESEGRWRGTVRSLRPVAMFVEFVYESDGVPLSLTTTVHRS